MFFRKLLFLSYVSSKRRQRSIASYTLRVRKNAIQGFALSQRAATLKYMNKWLQDVRFSFIEEKGTKQTLFLKCLEALVQIRN